METLLEKVNEASLKFLSPLETDELYATIVNEARKIIDVDFGSILLAENDELKRVYASAPFFGRITNRKRGFTYQCFHEIKLMVLDVDALANFHPAMKEEGIKTVVLIPLSYRQKAIGVLGVQSKKKLEISNAEVSALKLFGSMASLAIKKTQLYDETKRALEVRDLFISLASHELRTPLTSINGYIQLLYSKLGKQDNSEGKWIRELYDESGRMTNMVKELLEVNRIKQGQLQFALRECHAGEIVQNAAERFAFTHPKRTLTVQKHLKGEHSDMIIGDPDKLLQMIGNLLNNAVKFSPHETPIELTVSSNKNEVIIHVKDEGQGIDIQDLPYIFDEFYKGSRNNEQHGMGVGLLLAKHIVKFHKGEIQAKPDPEKGTIMEVRLPRVKA